MQFPEKLLFCSFFIILLFLAGCNFQDKRTAVLVAEDFIKNLKEANTFSLLKIAPWINKIDPEKLSQLSAALKTITGYKVQSVDSKGNVYFVSIKLLFTDKTRLLTIPIQKLNKEWIVKENFQFSVYIDHFEPR